MVLYITDTLNTFYLIKLWLYTLKQAWAITLTLLSAVPLPSMHWVLWLLPNGPSLVLLTVPTRCKNTPIKDTLTSHNINSTDRWTEQHLILTLHQKTDGRMRGIQGSTIPAGTNSQPVWSDPAEKPTQHWLLKKSSAPQPTAHRAQQTKISWPPNWPPNSQDPNAIKHPWDIRKVWSMEAQQHRAQRTH